MSILQPTLKVAIRPPNKLLLDIVVDFLFLVVGHACGGAKTGECSTERGRVGLVYVNAFLGRASNDFTAKVREAS